MRRLSSEGCNALAAKGGEMEYRERHTVFTRRKDYNFIDNFITMLRLQTSAICTLDCHVPIPRNLCASEVWNETQ